MFLITKKYKHLLWVRLMKTNAIITANFECILFKSEIIKNIIPMSIV